MNDLELAEEIETLVKDRPIWADVGLEPAQWQQIIAALRRWPEHAIAEREGYPGPTVPWGDGRPPSGEMVMVPREPTDAIVWAICEHSDAPIDRERCLRCPAKEPTYYGEGTRGCRALAEDQFRAMLSAAEAEGRKS